MKLISLVFSFRNEEKNLSELVDRIKSTFENLSDFNYEIIFVNDASDDNSECVLESLQINNPIIDPVSMVASVPPMSERRPRRARSPRRSGAIPPIPPIIIAMEPKLAKPHRA